MDELDLRRICVAQIDFFADGSCSLAIPADDKFCATIYPAIVPALAVVALLSAKTIKFEAIAKLLKVAYASTPVEELCSVCGIEVGSGIQEAHVKYKKTSDDSRT